MPSKANIPIAACLGAALLSAFAVGRALAECAPPANVPLCLVGITTAPDYATALVETPDSEDTVRLLPGDPILDWKVAAIGPTNLTLSRAGQSLDIDLSTDVADYTGPAIRRGPMVHASMADGQRPPH